MKLTNSIRSAFVRAAMDDVPQIDYDETIRKAVTEAALRALPPAVRKVYDDEKLRPYLECTFIRCGDVSVSVVGRDSRWKEPESQLPKLSKQDQTALDKLAAQQKEQEATREALQKKLTAAAYAVSTRKGLVELLPEFEKYLPADEAAANRSLPVVANIVADFTKAGWPKGKKPAAKSKATA
jgi:hypothetical protein